MSMQSTCLQPFSFCIYFFSFLLFPPSGCFRHCTAAKVFWTHYAPTVPMHYHHSSPLRSLHPPACSFALCLTLDPHHALRPSPITTKQASGQNSHQKSTISIFHQCLDGACAVEKSIPTMSSKDPMYSWHLSLRVDRPVEVSDAAENDHGDTTSYCSCCAVFLLSRDAF